jgi:peptidoglycan/xylan/chitin deacetylase (PgdA/CDA1 family)
MIPATIARTRPDELTATFLPADAGLSYSALRWQVLSAVNPPACAAAAGCSVVSPAQPALLRMHTPKLIGCVAGGPDWVFRGPTGRREVALTFDDGPAATPPSIQFVDLLAREHAPATFFEIGRQISQYDPRGAIERRMLADGDMIGDHTWSHPVMTALSASAQRAQLAMTAAAIKRATGGFEPCLFRAPYGAVDPGLLRVAHSLGMATIQWNVDPRDWSLPGVSAIVANVVANTRDGSIVIQHFGGGPRYQTLAALPQEIAALRRRGYTFVTVAQMLGYKLIYK